MAQFFETRTRTFTAGAALSQHRRVRLSSGELAYAGASDDDDLGTLHRDVAAGEAVAVHLRTLQGTQLMVASKAIAVGDKVYTAASGKVSDTQATGAFLRGIALTAASEDGDIIEVLPIGGEVAGS